MQELFKKFKQADIKFICLHQKALLGSDVTENSFGLSYMPPLIARRLKMYNENGVARCEGKMLEFYFNILNGNFLTDDAVMHMHNQIMKLKMTYVQTSVCCFLCRDAITKLIGLIRGQTMHYWAVTTISDDTKLFEIYNDAFGLPCTRQISQKQLFQLN